MILLQADTVYLTYLVKQLVNPGYK